MISATRNKVKWEREEGKGRITPLILGNSGFYFILFLGLALLLCAKKTKGGVYHNGCQGMVQTQMRSGTTSGEVKFLVER
jgi:hypothetical protein